MKKHFHKQLFFGNKASLKKGFTIVEALVAIFILVVSVTALLGVVSQSIFTAGYIKNKAVAISLAQEGIELVRNIQDSELLVGDYASFPVFAGTVFQPCVFGEGFCTIDPLSLEINSCSNDGVCSPLRISDSGYFNYGIGEESAFTRSISIVPTGPDSGRARVLVEWQQGNAPREVVYETDLFLWIQ